MAVERQAGELREGGHPEEEHQGEEHPEEGYQAEARLREGRPEAERPEVGRREVEPLEEGLLEVERPEGVLQVACREAYPEECRGEFQEGEIAWAEALQQVCWVESRIQGAAHQWGAARREEALRAAACPGEALQEGLRAGGHLEEVLAAEHCADPAPGTVGAASRGAGCPWGASGAEE